MWHMQQNLLGQSSIIKAFVSNVKETRQAKIGLVCNVKQTVSASNIR